MVRSIRPMRAMMGRMTLPPEPPQPPGGPPEGPEGDRPPGAWPPPVPAEGPPPMPPPVSGKRGSPGPVAMMIIGGALVAGVVVGVVLARSGGDSNGGSGKVSIPAGWTAQDASDEGFRLALPPGWQEVEPGRVDDSLDQVREDNPELAEVIESQLSGSLSDLVRFFAFDTRSPTLAEQFATNVNVVVEPLPGGVDFDEYLDANLSQLRTVPGVRVSGEDEVSLPGGRAAVITSTFTLNSPSGPKDIAVTQYLLMRGDRGFILSMTTTPGHIATYRETFEQIARTFEPI